MRGWASAHHPAASGVQFEDLQYQGGSGAGLPGIIAGPEKVYLVFWGSQWGSQSTSNGNLKLSGDRRGAAGILQRFFKGLGTGGETYSGVATQYCSGVPAGSVSCPAGVPHVGYPSGGALAGVWADESAAAPSAATGHQLAAEAIKAAAHFGNTSQAANANTQYVIISPHGTNPDGYRTGGFCAWHDWTADSTLDGGGGAASSFAAAFTNLPYLSDVGRTCGASFVNGSTGGNDGFTIVEGHEYNETITDTSFPGGSPGGWYDPNGAPYYTEIGDKCAWLSPGGAGGSFNLSLTTGTFPVQTEWANDGPGGASSCEGSHPIQ